MKILILCLALGLVGCSTLPKSRQMPKQTEFGHQFDSASDAEKAAYLFYVVTEERKMHAAQLKSAESRGTFAVPELPPSDLLSTRVCRSEPIFDLYGRYVRTSTVCN